MLKEKSPHYLGQRGRTSQDARQGGSCGNLIAGRGHNKLPAGFDKCLVLPSDWHLSILEPLIDRYRMDAEKSGDFSLCSEVLK